VWPSAVAPLADAALQRIIRTNTFRAQTLNGCGRLWRVSSQPPVRLSLRVIICMF